MTGHAEHAVVIAGGGPTGLDVGGESWRWRGSTSPLSSGVRARMWTVRVQAVCTHAPLRSSTSVASRNDSSPRDKFTRLRGSPGSSWKSATSPPATTTCLHCGKRTSSPSWLIGVGELGVQILRGREVAGFAQDNTGVDVGLSDGHSLRAEYLVGCDGGRSLVRKAAGIDFPGLDPSTSWMIAEVEMDEPELGMRPEGGGIGPVNPAEGGGPFRVALTEGYIEHTSEPTLEDLSGALIGAYGTNFGVPQPDLDLPFH